MNKEKEHSIKINIPGGIIAAGDLYGILQVAERSGVQNIVFGNRQQLYFKVNASRLNDLSDQLFISDIHFEIDANEFPNLVSSYVTAGIFDHPNWLSEGVYKDILDLYTYQPRLKINLVNSTQCFVPYFTGNLNFIASETSNYWYLYVRFPKTNSQYLWPSLIYSEDIPGISRAIENVIFAERILFYNQPGADGAMLHLRIKEHHNFIIQPFVQPFTPPVFQLPYYEGSNLYGTDKYWLGVYRREESFSLDFLKDICALCLQTRVGQVYTTPWKSLIVKNIHANDRVLWTAVLNKNRINIRHAANELNWQVEDLCPEGLELKQKLVKVFEDADIRTHRLCFAVKTKDQTGLFGSVIVRKNAGGQSFELIHTRDFNPNSKDFVSYKQGLKRSEIGKHLVGLCNKFYDSQTGTSILAAQPETNSDEPAKVRIVRQCPHCLTVFNPSYDDSAQAILPIQYPLASQNYTCTTCDAPSGDFILVEESALYQA